MGRVDREVENFVVRGRAGDQQATAFQLLLGKAVRGGTASKKQKRVYDKFVKYVTAHPSLPDPAISVRAGRVLKALQLAETPQVMSQALLQLPTVGGPRAIRVASLVLAERARKSPADLLALAKTFPVQSPADEVGWAGIVVAGALEQVAIERGDFSAVDPLIAWEVSERDDLTVQRPQYQTRSLPQ